MTKSCEAAERALPAACEGPVDSCMAEASSDDGDAAAAAAQLREEDEVDARLAFQYEARRQVRTGFLLRACCECAANSCRLALQQVDNITAVTLSPWLRVHRRACGRATS